MESIIGKKEYIIENSDKGWRSGFLDRNRKT